MFIMRDGNEHVMHTPTYILPVHQGLRLLQFPLVQSNKNVETLKRAKELNRVTLFKLKAISTTTSGNHAISSHGTYAVIYTKELIGK